MNFPNLPSKRNLVTNRIGKSPCGKRQKDLTTTYSLLLPTFSLHQRKDLRWTAPFGYLLRFRHHPLDPLTSFFANFTDFPIGSLSLSLSCQHRGTRVSAVSVAFIPNPRQAAITLDRNPLHEFPEFTFQTQLGYESNW